MITLFTSDTANGQKAAFMLEECGLPHQRIAIDLQAGEHLAPPFLARNPLGKIPVLTDEDGPGGAAITISQSAAIVRYLAGKTGLLLPSDPREAAMADQFASLVSADLSAAFTGIFQFGVLPQARGEVPVEAALDHSTAQAHRGLAVIETRLNDSPWLAGSTMTYADVLAYPVARTSVRMLGGDPLRDYPAIRRWATVIASRPTARSVFG